MSTFAALDPDDAVSTALGDAEAAVGVALDVAEGRVAVLVAETGRRTSYDTSATAVALFDLPREGAAVRTGTVPLPSSPGQAQHVAWLDPSTLAITRSTEGTRILEVVTLDGAVVSTTDLGWQPLNAIVLGDRQLRLRSGGLELRDRFGTATPLIPAPGPGPYWESRSAGLAAFPDGPTIPALRPDPPALHDPLPLVAPPSTTPATEPPTSSSPAAPATIPAGPTTTAVGDVTDDGDGGGATALVVGLVLVGLVAVGGLLWWRRARRA